MKSLCGAPLMARLEADLEHLPFPAFLIDIDGDDFRFRKVNTAYEQATGMACAQVAGRRAEELMTPECAAVALRQMRECRDQGRPQRFSIYADTPGTAGLWHTAFEPLPDRDGIVIGLHGLTVDLGAETMAYTETGSAVLRYARAREEAQILSHDLITDLAAILVSARRLSAALTNRPAADSAAASLARDLHTAMSLADLRVEAAGRELSHTLEERTERRVELDRLCARICAEHDRSGIEISFGEDEIISDPVLLHVVLRLMVQAACATAQKWVEVDVYPADSGYFILRVRDDRAAPTEPATPIAPQMIRIGQIVAPHGGSVHTGGDTRWSWTDVRLPGAFCAETPDAEIEGLALSQ